MFNVNLKRLSEAKEMPLSKYIGAKEEIIDSKLVGGDMVLDVAAKIKTQPQQTQLAVIYEPKREITDLSVLASTDGDSAAPLTKPAAVWNPEKKKMMWKVGKVAAGQAGKLLAQWEVKERSSQFPMIAVKYVYSEMVIASQSLVQVAGGGESISVPEEHAYAVNQMITPSVLNS